MAHDAVTPGEGMKERAEQRMAEALERSGLPDPRERYREWLRELRSRDEPAFRKALDYFEERLVPALSEEGSDAIAEWTEYGLRLAQRLRPGSAVAIDDTGLSRSCDASAAREHLVLHLPKSARQSALAVRLPARLSAAQEAAVKLLVEQDHR